jgi:hypothetical protein
MRQRQCPGGQGAVESSMAARSASSRGRPPYIAQVSHGSTSAGSVDGNDLRFQDGGAGAARRPLD